MHFYCWVLIKKKKKLTQNSWYSVLNSLAGYFPDGSDDKEHTCNAWDPGSIPELGRSLGEGNGYTLQYSCLQNPMDGGAWWVTVHGVPKAQTTEQLTLSLSSWNGMDCSLPSSSVHGIFQVRILERAAISFSKNGKYKKEWVRNKDYKVTMGFM